MFFFLFFSTVLLGNQVLWFRIYSYLHQMTNTFCNNANSKFLIIWSTVCLIIIENFEIELIFNQFNIIEWNYLYLGEISLDTIYSWILFNQTLKTFHGNRWFLVQDKDPKHTSKVARTWMDTNMKKNQFEWPSQSPDLSPIENIFGWLKHQLIRRRPRTISDLKDQLLDLWESLSPEFLAPYWKSMKKRCELVTSNNGYAIKY